MVDKQSKILEIITFCSQINDLRLQIDGISIYQPIYLLIYPSTHLFLFEIPRFRIENIDPCLPRFQSTTVRMFEIITFCSQINDLRLQIDGISIYQPIFLLIYPSTHLFLFEKPRFRIENIDPFLPRFRQTTVRMFEIKLFVLKLMISNFKWMEYLSINLSIY